MIAPRRFVYIAVVLALLFVCGTPYTFAQFNGPGLTAEDSVNRPVVLTTDPAILFPPSRDIHLVPGDTVSIHIYGSTDYDPIVKVSLDSSLLLPLIGPVSVRDLPLPDAERLIAARLEAAGMYHNPQVTITIMDSTNQVATVMGEAHGSVPTLTPRRLFDVLAMSGGLPPTASHVITIQRPGIPDPIVVDLGVDPAHSRMANIPIFAGDTVIVGRVGSVYILGSVRVQGATPLIQASPLTMIQLLAQAGGALFEARLNDAKIIRTQGVHRTMINVRLKDVIKGQAPDPILQADDIVLIPNNAFRSAIRSGGIGTAIGIISVLSVILTR